MAPPLMSGSHLFFNSRCSAIIGSSCARPRVKPSCSQQSSSLPHIWVSASSRQHELNTCIKITLKPEKMTYKTLTISEEAHAALSDLKLEGESFTNAIMRLAKARNDRPLSSFAGRWRGSIEETKANFDKLDRMWVEYGRELKGRLSFP